MERAETTIYTLLNAIGGFNLYQIRPEVLEDIETTPTVIFNIQNIPNTTLDKGIAFQEITVRIDVYGKTSKITGNIMIAIESAMRNAGYPMTGNLPIPDPSGFSHLNLTFEGVL